MSDLPREWRRDLSLWMRFNAGLWKTLLCFLIGTIIGLFWAWGAGLL